MRSINWMDIQFFWYNSQVMKSRAPTLTVEAQMQHLKVSWEFMKAFWWIRIRFYKRKSRRKSRNSCWKLSISWRKYAALLISCLIWDVCVSTSEPVVTQLMARLGSKLKSMPISESKLSEWQLNTIDYWTITKWFQINAKLINIFSFLSFIHLLLSFQPFCL